jgi:hypothetical protein
MFLVIAAVVFALWLFVVVTSKVTGALIHLLLLVVAAFIVLQFLGIG